MTIGLVLEGGAMRGLYSAGVVDALMKVQIAVDGMVSVSAGSLVGINYLSNQPERLYRYNMKYLNDNRYFGWKHLIHSGSIVNQDFTFQEIPNHLDVFDNETYKKSNVKFYSVVTNVETGQAEYMQIDDVIKQTKVLQATSSMPFVSQMIEIDGNKYLDGGICDSIPIKFAQTLGYDKYILVLTRPVGYRKTKPKQKLIWKHYAEYPNLVKAMQMRYIKYNEMLNDIEQQKLGSNVFVIRPSEDLNVKRLERNPQRLQHAYQLGKQNFESNTEALLSFLNE